MKKTKQMDTERLLLIIEDDAAFARTLGRSFERRGYTVSWVKTAEGTEVDFHAHAPGERARLVQVCATVRDATTLAREVRALQHALADHPKATAVLLTLDETPPVEALPREIEWQPAAAWLLGGM